MALYNKVDTSMDFVGREREIEKFWKDNDIFEKSIKEHEGDPSYVFYDGPPTANGKPHIGHVLTRCIKDMIPRYQTMKGKMVPRKAGWDTHGLPVELEVEKQIGINGKEQIESYGIAPFVELCKENVWKYKGMWEDFSFTVGFWADMEHPYVTYYDDYIESEFWALKEIWDKGLLYKGFKVVPYCPRCGTPLSSHEVAQGYKDVKERSAIVRFKCVDEDAFILAWTTTPWTLPSNVALCVNPDETYVKAKAEDGRVYYLADALKSKLGENVEVLETMKGTDLEYKPYVPLFETAAKLAEKQHKKAHYIVCDTYVSMSDGTGVVHIAPAFGEDDAKVGRKYDLPFVQLVDGKGNMTDEEEWKGVFVKKADPMILKNLESRGLLFDAPVFEHSYPHCWRCNTPLIYYARESWYIAMSKVKDDLVRNNATINWIPESIGKGRFGEWIANVQDWALSRNRYWGTPLPIWECECGHRECVGSRKQLREESTNYDEVLSKLKAEGDKGWSEEGGIELHRPYIDRVKLKCPECGKEMTRVTDVIDCWFDSGAMPFAQHHYPFENQELFHKEFPAQFISEAVDQTRGWFYSLLAESTLLFNKAPYENVIVLGHVQDENGQKMSKSKGNAVDPVEALNTYGADAIRWYFYTNSAPWLPNRFYGKAVVEGQRKFLGTLWNTYAFYILYANIDNFDPTKYELRREGLPVMDRWILSKMNTMIKTVDSNMSQYKIPESCAALEDFVDELSNWYVRRCRERFWRKGMEQDKIDAYMTLYTALYNAILCAAPFIPFMTDAIYRNMVCSVDKSAKESVHLCSFPQADESMIDTELEKSMDEVLSIVILGRAARNASGLKNRQPIAGMFVRSDMELGAYYKDILKDELNLKNVEFRDDLREFTAYTFKPQLKTVGPKYGKNLGFIRQYLSEMDGSAAMDKLNTEGVLKFDAPDGTSIELTKDDLLIDSAKKGGYVTEEDAHTTVVLDTNLTEDLVAEGLMRELISKVQTMRKEAGFEVMDHIVISIKSTEKLLSAVNKYKDTILHDCMADALNEETPHGYVKSWDINGEEAEIGVEKQA